jgi:hypothetical protein
VTPLRLAHLDRLVLGARIVGVEVDTGTPALELLLENGCSLRIRLADRGPEAVAIEVPDGVGLLSVPTSSTIQ